MIIYKTTNLVNGKIYVGKDIHDDINYFGSGILLERAIKKYGKYNFKKEIIQKCLSIEELNIQEIYWINKLNSCDRNVGYNIAIGGDGGDTISNHPDRERIIENFRKRKHAVMTEEIKRKISMANRGKKKSEEHKEKLRIIQTGKKHHPKR